MNLEYVEKNATRMYEELNKKGWRLIIFHIDHGGPCCFPVAWVRTSVHLVEGEILKTEDVKSTSYLTQEAIVKFYTSQFATNNKLFSK